jgi:ribonuclease HII
MSPGYPRNPHRISLDRLEQKFHFDHSYGKHGLIAGIDEAGRGPWAGPVMAAAVVFGPGVNLLRLAGLDDSKKLTPHRRATLAEAISQTAQAVGVGSASPKEIDEMNIEQATFLAMRRALADLGMIPDLALVDGNRDPRLGIPSRTVVSGDASSAAIAAASIIAKTTRDRCMEILEGEHERWGFARHKGYGTEYHQYALRVFGVSGHHRRTFKSVARRLFHNGPSRIFLQLWEEFQACRDEPDWERLQQAFSAEAPRLDASESWLLSRRLEEVKTRMAQSPTRPGMRAEGSFYESLIPGYLARKGYQVLERNFQTRTGEIDLIARDGETLVFVEVKKRSTQEFGSAASAVDARKRKHLTLAALEYLSRFPTPVDCRFDVVALETGPDEATHLEHFPNAFEMDRGEFL